MVTTTLNKLTQEFMAAFNSHDVDKILFLYTNDCFIEDVATGKTYRGMQEFRKYNHDYFAAFPDVKLEIKMEIRSGDWAAYEWEMTGTHRGVLPASKNMPEISPTNKKFSIRGATINQLRNDKVSRETNYYDMASFMMQLGLMPAAPMK
jgi:steroid delta-isomerase-like uncharacterized protein